MRKKNHEEPRESSLASGWTIEAAGAGNTDAAVPAADDDNSTVAGNADVADAADAETAEDAPADPAQLPSIALVFLGVTGGVYLLYAWIWLSWAQYYSTFNAQIAGAAGSVGGALQQFVFWLAPLAPILWFLAAMIMNRGSFKRAAIWILAGLVVLLPLPVFSGLGA